MLLIILATIILFSGYLLKKHYEYWKVRGIPGPKPTLFVGNVAGNFLLKKSLNDIYIDLYKQYPSSPIVGAFKGTKPILIIRDPNLIKTILVTDFSDFQENNLIVDKKVDPFFGRNPFTLVGEEWKHTRGLLTPSFTGGKMKLMFQHLDKNSLDMAEYVEKQAMDAGGYEAKELCCRFTVNNVASCAFGIEGRCFTDDKAEFRHLAEDFFTLSRLSKLKYVLSFFIPNLERYFPMKHSPAWVEAGILEIVSQSLKYRKENKVKQDDFLQDMDRLLEKSVFTMVDVGAAAAAFFLDGFETSASAMSHFLYELAANPGAQAELREEIRAKTAEEGFTYQTVQDMAYLDAALSEALRMHPPLQNMFKVCTKAYNCTPNSGNIAPFLIEKGTEIVIPVQGLQTDEKYYQNPDVFQPERFLGANRKAIEKCTYLPLGDGPRACLGQRFGVLQIKCGVARLISKYEISVNEKTRIPFKNDPLNFISFILAPIGGIWLNFKKL